MASVENRVKIDCYSLQKKNGSGTEKSEEHTWNKEKYIYCNIKESQSI